MAERIENEKHNITVFGTETEFDGVLEFNSKLVITGKFNGKINAPEGDLEIEKAITLYNRYNFATTIRGDYSIRGNPFRLPSLSYRLQIQRYKGYRNVF